MTTVLVLGGAGYFGKQVVMALKAHNNLQVLTGSRQSKDRQIDLANPTTFSALQDCDIIINCTDTVKVQPDGAIAHVLAQGGTFIETTDDAKTLHRLINTWRGQNTTATAGRLIIGMGIMPGLSNIVAAALVRKSANVDTLEVAIRFNPLSGAGAGMNRLTAQVIANVGKRFVDGKLVNSPPMWFAPLIPFRDGYGTAVRTGLPEALMLGYSTSAKTTAAYLSTGSPILETALLGTAFAFPQDAIFKPIATDILSRAINEVRGGFLRNMRTPFEIVALANRRNWVQHDGDWLRVWLSDGILAGGAAVAAGVQLMLSKNLAPGVYLPDEVFELDDLINHLAQTSGLRVETTWNLVHAQTAV